MSDTGSLTHERRLIQVDGPSLGHIPSFDGLRGLFIIQVVLYHAEVTLFIKGSPILIDWFFVASGFLITTLLLDEFKKTGDIGLRRFYKRRALRLFPAMYAMIAVFSVLMFVAMRFIPDQDGLESLWWLESLSAALYVYNIVAAFFPGTMGILGYLWSLAVEEQFYFGWPPLMRRILRKRTRRTDMVLIGGAITFVVVFFGLRYGLGSAIETSASTGNPTYADEGDITWQGVVYRIASTRPDVIVLGCLTAVLARKIPRPVPERIRKVLAVVAYIAWAWFGLVLLTCAPGAPSAFSMFGGPVYQIGLLMLVPIMLDGYLRQDTWYSRLFSMKWAQWLGLRIYGIYVWHGIVLLMCAPAILGAYGMQRRLIGTAASVLAIGAGLLSYRFLEQRFLRSAGSGVLKRKTVATSADAGGTAGTKESGE